MTIERVIDEPCKKWRSRRARRPCETMTSMRVVKHEKQITCPWCNTGTTMTLQDKTGEYCMACKKELATGRPMQK